MGNTQASEHEIRNIVQEQLQRSNNQEQSEFLRDIIRALDQRNTAAKEEMEKSLNARVEELSQKLEKLDREKQVSDNKVWLKGLLGKIADAGAVRDSQYRERGRGRPWDNRQGSNPRIANDHLPWTDGPKRGQNTFQKIQTVTTQDTYVTVKPADGIFKPYGRGHYRGGLHHGRGQYHQLTSQGQTWGESGNTFQQSSFGSEQKNYQQRGNYRGRGRGAIPKNMTAARPSDGIPGADEIEQLGAKLQNLSTTDVQVTLTPEEIIAIKNALKEKNNPKKKQETTPEQQGQKDKKTKAQSSKKNQESTPEQQGQTDKKTKTQSSKKNQESTPEQQGQTDKKTKTNKRKQTVGGSEMTSSPLMNLPPSSPPVQMPLQLYPANVDESAFQFLPGSQQLENAMLMAQDGNSIVTHQPRTIQELKDFKAKHPTAKLFSLKPSS